MKITMYELLGMIKDGKAPKKIKYDNNIFEYDGDFYSSEHNLILDEYCNLTVSLNDEVVILEEEKKIPEKIKDKYCSQISKVELAQKYNEIIDYLKSKGE